MSLADAPARILAREIQEDVALPRSDGGGVPFRLAIATELVDVRARYNVRVHIDVTGTGRVTVGDYVTTRSTPPDWDGREMAIEVRRV